jgi:hypothetical protein
LNFSLEELEEKFARHLEPSVKLLQKAGSPAEYSVMHAVVTKRRGLSMKSRMLVLTNKARLMYFDMNGAYKGAIPWSVTKPVSIVLVRCCLMKYLFSYLTFYTRFFFHIYFCA